MRNVYKCSFFKENMLDKYSHHHSMHRFIHNKYNELVVAQACRTFALSLISLFLPIFLLEKGFSISIVLIFEMILIILSVPMHLLTFHIIRMGIKKTLILSYFVSIVFYGLLFFTDFLLSHLGMYAFLVVIGIVNIISFSLFWMSFHLYFIKSTRKHHGKRFGLLMGLPVLLSVISPFVGGLLIDNFSFKAAFLVTVIILFLGVLALFFSKEIHASSKLSTVKIFKGHGLRANALFFIEGANIAGTSLLWPILLFFLGIKIVSMGLLYFFSNALFAIMSYVSGKLSDANKGTKAIQLASIGHGASLILRALTTSLFFMTIAQSLGGIFSALLRVPFRSKFYKDSSKDSANKIMTREFYQHSGRVFLLLVIFGLMLFLPIITAFIVGLIITGVITFGFSVLVSEDGEIELQHLGFKK